MAIGKTTTKKATSSSSMKYFFNYLFSLDKKPKKGLMAYEWVVLTYLVATFVYILIMYRQLPNAGELLWGRIQIAAIMLALWGIYRLIPCGLTYLARPSVQLALLAWWYPDIYGLNRIYPNLDHVFASLEQSLFGCQPALVFSEWISHPVISELMYLGYWSYYVLLAIVGVSVMIWRRKSNERIFFVIIGTFFIHYVIFILLPVSGPQYYYEAVGVDDIRNGIFPNLHDYFNHHQERMTSPGYADGVFYSLVDSAHRSGERPIAAFPSSHVSVCLVLMLIVWKERLHLLFGLLLPIAVLLIISTVYIRAHYAIDVLGGLASGIICYGLLMRCSRRLK